MVDYVKYCREQTDDTFYDPLKESWTMVGNHIEKLEAALREIAQTVTIRDENWHPSYHDSSFTQKQAEGLEKSLAEKIQIARKALEGKDE
jgi:hypothetical protein